ncbi:hypothetical protein D3C73_1263180 [compost metagenome]
MGKIGPLRASCQNLAERSAGRVIGQMAHIAENPPLRIPGIAPHPEHFYVVIGFQHENISVRDCQPHLLTDIAQVCRHAELLLANIEVVADRLGGVMRDGERLDPHVPKVKMLPGLQSMPVMLFDAADALLDCSPCVRIGIDRQIIFARHRSKPLDMVGVLMRHEDAG